MRSGRRLQRRPAPNDRFSERVFTLVWISLFLAAALTALDQTLKTLVVATVKPVGSVSVIPGLLTWRYSENTGAAFGMMQNCRWIFLVVTIVLMSGCLYVLVKYFRRNAYACFVLALILSGGLGNMIDRVLQGYVVDYIYLSFFPAIFNFADCCVVLGAILAVVGYLISERRSVKKAANPEASDHESA